MADIILERNQQIPRDTRLRLYHDNGDGTHTPAVTASAPGARLQPQRQLLLDADTEYVFVVPACTGFEFRATTNAVLRCAFETGVVASGVGSFFTLNAGEQFSVLANVAACLLYVASTTDAVMVELLAYEVV
jgi:hypothetical protein